MATYGRTVMSCAFMLKLVDQALAERRIVGRIEVVQTGEASVIRDASELIAFLLTSGPSMVRVGPEESKFGTEALTPGAAGASN